MCGSKEPESGYVSVSQVSHFKGLLLGKWLGIFLRLWSDKALPHRLSLMLSEIRLLRLPALGSAQSHYKLPLIKCRMLVWQSQRRHILFLRFCCD